MKYQTYTKYKPSVVEWIGYLKNLKKSAIIKI